MGRVLVIGASPNPARFSYHCIKSLIGKGFEVYAIGNKQSAIEHVKIKAKKLKLADIDCVILYINPAIQQQYISYISKLKPRKLLFNPGTFNSEMEEMARKNGIQIARACALFLIEQDKLL